MSDFADLMATVEQLRAEHYPQLSSDIVQKLLTIEATQPGDRPAAIREIKQAVLGVLPTASAESASVEIAPTVPKVSRA